MIESSDKSNKTRLNWAEVFWTVCWVWYLDRWHLGNRVDTDMKFVKNFTPPDFQAKNFTPSISPNFNSFSDKNTKKWVKMEKFTPLAKILHCRRHWRHWQISTLDSKHSFCQPDDSKHSFLQHIWRNHSVTSSTPVLEGGNIPVFTNLKYQPLYRKYNRLRM